VRSVPVFNGYAQNYHFSRRIQYATLSAFSILENFAIFADMSVPAEVLKAAASLVDAYGAHFSLLGKREGRDVYCYEFPRNQYTGFPFVYLYGDGKVEEVTGEEALELIALFDAE